MHIAKGDDRIVLVIPGLGIVIKVPNFRTSTHNVRHCAGMLWMNRREVVRYPWGCRRFIWYVIEAIGKFLLACVRGVVANWCEWAYFLSADPMRCALLAPTHVSIFGLLNIQSYRKPSDDRGFGIEYALRFACDDMDPMEFKKYDDNHHFQNQSNFHVPDDRTIVFLDYGSRKVQRLLNDFGPKIATSFFLSGGRRREEGLRRYMRSQRFR